MLTTADKRAAFRKLHESGCFIIPNPFDVGSAKALQHLGFKALASTSAGFAWTVGKPDNRVTVDDVCDHLTAISAAVDIPVNADFEDGFAHEPEKVQDPCQPRPWSNPQSLSQIANQFTISALDGAACQLGVTRETLALALTTGYVADVDPQAPAKFEALLRAMLGAVEPVAALLAHAQPPTPREPPAGG